MIKRLKAHFQMHVRQARSFGALLKRLIFGDHA